MNELINRFLEESKEKKSLWLTPLEKELAEGSNIHLAQAVPDSSASFQNILWTDSTHLSGDRKAILARLVALLAPGGYLFLQTRVIPATKLRGRKGKEVKFAGEYLNAFHRFYRPGTTDAVSQYIWQKWLTEAGLNIKDTQVGGVKTYLRLHPDHSEKDFIRLKVLLIHAPEVAKQLLTAHVSLDRIHFHVYQANFVCRLENYE